MAKKKSTNKKKGNGVIKEKPMVKILFDGLTHAGKVYKSGEVERDPSEHLIMMAEDGTKYFHRDLQSRIKVCEFVEEGVRYKKKSSNGEFTPEMLSKMEEFELVRILVKRFGFSRSAVCVYERERLENSILAIQEV